jgi:hypothetical protein
MLLLAIVVLSVSPASYRPVTGASSIFEHLAIILAAGTMLGIGYRDRLALLAGGLLLYCGLVEVVQFWVPGRHARLSDFLVDAASALAGVAIAALAEQAFSAQETALRAAFIRRDR